MHLYSTSDTRRHSLCIAHSAFCIAVAIATTMAPLLSSASLTAAHYVQDGLVACWDGIENAGAGVHADSLSQWVDLVGGRSFTLSNPTVGARAIRFSGASDSYGVLSAANTTATFGLAGVNGMIEVVYVQTSGSVFLQSSGDSGIAVGKYGNALSLGNKSGSSVALPLPAALQSQTNTVSVGYKSYLPQSAQLFRNGDAVTAGSGTYWGGANTLTHIGRRASGATAAVSFYSIRVYKRKLTPVEIAYNRMVDKKRFIDAEEEGAAPEAILIQTDVNDDLSATFTYAIACGGGASSAEVSIAWGKDADAPNHTNLVAAAAPPGFSRDTIRGLLPNTDYYARIIVRNGAGLSAATEPIAFKAGPAPVDETGPGRTIAITSADFGPDGSATSLNLEFGEGEEDVSNSLFVLLGNVYGGVVTGDWTRVERVASIGPDETSLCYDLPAGWGTEYRFLRFAFDLDTPLPYDGMVEYIGSNGQQWINTGVKANIPLDGGLEAHADVTFLSTGDVGLLSARTSGSRVYLIYNFNNWCIGYGGSYTTGGTLLTGERYAVDAVLHDGAQSITANGIRQVSAKYTGAITTGLNLFVFRMNNNGATTPAAGIKARLYGLSISQDGTPLRDFLPCTVGGAGALYDKVSATIFRNASTTPFTLGPTVPMQVFKPFSPTYYYTEADRPAFASCAVSSVTADSIALSGVLQSFGGAREDCRVALLVSTDGPDGEFSQVGAAVTPGADGSFTCSATGLPSGQAYWLRCVATAASGASVSSATFSETTLAGATVTCAADNINGSTLTVRGRLDVAGASDALVALYVGTNATTAVEKARTTLSAVGDPYALVWSGYLDDCDWTKRYYWEVRVITAFGQNAWTNVFGKTTFLLKDTNTYEWTGAGTADDSGFRDWCDTNNWRTASASPDKAGCPINAYATAAFTSGDAASVTVPKRISLRKLRAASAGLDLVVQGAGSPRIDMTLFLVTDNDSANGRPVMVDVSGEGTRVTLRDLAVDEANSVRISGGATLALENVQFSVDGLFNLSPTFASAVGTAYSGGRCELSGGSRLAIRKDASGTFSGLFLSGGGEMVVRDATLDSSVIFDYKTGGGLLRLEGAAPVVSAGLLRGHAAASIPNAGTGVVEFEVPAAGYAAAPVRVAGSAVGGAVDMADVAPFSIRVSRRSPALGSGRLSPLPLVSAPNGVTRGRVILVPASRCAFLLGELAASPWNWQPAGSWSATAAPKSIGVEISPPSGSVIFLM